MILDGQVWLNQVCLAVYEKKTGSAIVPRITFSHVICIFCFLADVHTKDIFRRKTTSFVRPSARLFLFVYILCTMELYVIMIFIIHVCVLNAGNRVCFHFIHNVFLIAKCNLFPKVCVCVCVCVVPPSALSDFVRENTWRRFLTLCCWHL